MRITDSGKTNKSANCWLCKDAHNQWLTLVLIAFICFTVSVFVFSGSTREILARGAIPSLNNPVKSRPPLAAVARRRELAPQIIDVSFPVCMYVCNLYLQANLASSTYCWFP